MTAPRMTPGPCWRIAPAGTMRCYLNRWNPDGTASVSNRVGSGWAKAPMTVASADLFPDRDSARAEYRRRRALAPGQNRSLAGLNFATPLPGNGRTILTAPPGLTGMERKAWEWACGGIEDAIADPTFLRDNPGFTDDPQAQTDDLIYRLTEQAEQMISAGEPASVTFARAAASAAAKVRAAP
jgi:hypothetical protein